MEHTTFVFYDFLGNRFSGHSSFVLSVIDTGFIFVLKESLGQGHADYIGYKDGRWLLWS